ncbi:DMT family transporter, partial [Sinorhizobium meliloti]
LHGLYLGAVWWAIGQGVPAAISGIIAGLQPLMTAAVAPWLIGEKLAGQQKLGLILGFCGIALAVAPKMLAIDAAATPIHLLPLAVNVLGMAAVTYGTLYQKRYLQTGDIRSIAALQYVGALLVTIPLALMLEDLRVTWNIELVAALAWSVLGLSMGAIALLLYLIRRGQVSRAASLIYLVPPLAAGEAALFFGEALTWPMIIGTVIAVTGVYLTNRKAAGGTAASEPAKEMPAV